MEDVIKVIGSSVCSVTLLFIITRIIGAKEISQLSMLDYINGITIGSIAAELATDLENFIRPLTAMIVYGIAIITADIMTDKSIFLRKIISGKPLVLFDKGVFLYKNFKKAKINTDSFIMECRCSGYFNLNDIKTAIMETNGKMSILPKADKKPLTPYDVNLKGEDERVKMCVIKDGIVMEEALKLCGKNRKWLENQLSNQKYKLSEVMLAVCNDNDMLDIFKKDTKSRGFL